MVQTKSFERRVKGINLALRTEATNLERMAIKMESEARNLGYRVPTLEGLDSASGKAVGAKTVKAIRAIEDLRRSLEECRRRSIITERKL